MAVDLQEPDTRTPGWSETPQLLSSVEVARFVAQGFLRFDGIVGDDINITAVATLTAGLPGVEYGATVEEAFGPGTLAHDLLALPQVAGALHSLLGPNPTVDHDAIHVRRPHEGEAQDMHADAIIDVRTDAFDVQLMYYPAEVTLEMGGTLSVPGTHLRRVNETDVGRYQNLLGQTRLTCPAGTVVLLHHGIWHSGRRNDSDVARYMYKIRFNPTVKQHRWWDTTDLDSPEVAKQLSTRHPWMEAASGRLEVYNRVLLWRELSGDADFDVDWWVTRVHNHPALLNSPPERLRSPAMTTTQTDPRTATSTGDPRTSPGLRQQILVLYTITSALDSRVVGWSSYDGTGVSRPTTGDSDVPPYATGLDALLDGWRLIQAAQLIPPYPGHEYDVSFLKHEFFFEKLVDGA